MGTWRKCDVIAQFENRVKFYKAQNDHASKLLARTNDMTLSISAAHYIEAMRDLAFIKRGTNWRLALTDWVYNRMFMGNWSIPDAWKTQAHTK